MSQAESNPIACAARYLAKDCGGAIGEVLLKEPTATIFVEHRFTIDEFEILKQLTKSAGADSFYIIGWCTDFDLSQQRISQIQKFLTLDDSKVYKKSLLFGKSKHDLSFYDIFDTFAVTALSEYWIAYMDNRNDVGFISTFSPEFFTLVEPTLVTSRIALTTEELLKDVACASRLKIDARRLKLRFAMLQPVRT